MTNSQSPDRAALADELEAEAIAKLREFDRLGLVIESAVRNADAPNWATVTDLIKRTRVFMSMLGPAPSPSSGAELPVAWRWRTRRHDNSNKWNVTDKFSASLMENCIEMQPLYASPTTLLCDAERTKTTLALPGELT